ncbi:MAG TPA: hypothetical protein VJ862_00905, partial [Rhodanobacteraceae bacterium]|nr:hypothetical protein [Rhodanobacteraceae bacterium]
MAPLINIVSIVDLPMRIVSLLQCMPESLAGCSGYRFNFSGHSVRPRRVRPIWQAKLHQHRLEARVVAD